MHNIVIYFFTSCGKNYEIKIVLNFHFSLIYNAIRFCVDLLKHYNVPKNVEHLHGSAASHLYSHKAQIERNDTLLKRAFLHLAWMYSEQHNRPIWDSRARIDAKVTQKFTLPISFSEEVIATTFA